MTLYWKRDYRIALAALAVAVLAAVPAEADWLITLEGRLIETQGPWTIEGEILTYTDLEGEEHTFQLDEIDLEASEETTALRAGKPYVPSEALPPPSPDDRAPEAETSKKKNNDAKVFLYTDAFCPNCAKARELLRELGVEFVERDISQSRRAMRQYKKIAGRGGGVPVIDFDGRVVYRFDPRVIRERVEELRKNEADAGEE